MTNQCKNCPFYDSEYDQMKQSWDDVVIVGNEKPTEQHYCRMYETAIDKNIINDKEKCKYNIA